MAKLFVVHKENDFYPPGTWLIKDADGYQKCSVVRTANGWRVQERTGGIVVPESESLNECLFEMRKDGELDPKLADLLRATAFKG